MSHSAKHFPQKWYTLPTFTIKVNQMWVSKYTNTVDPMGLDKKTYQKHLDERHGRGRLSANQIPSGLPKKHLDAGLVWQTSRRMLVLVLQRLVPGKRCRASPCEVPGKKRRPLVGWIILGDEMLPSYIGIIVNHYYI